MDTDVPIRGSSGTVINLGSFSSEGPAKDPRSHIVSNVSIYKRPLSIRLLLHRQFPRRRAENSEILSLKHVHDARSFRARSPISDRSSVGKLVAPAALATCAPTKQIF